jgi:hypothetical protein
LIFSEIQKTEQDKPQQDKIDRIRQAGWEIQSRKDILG